MPLSGTTTPSGRVRSGWPRRAPSPRRRGSARLVASQIRRQRLRAPQDALHPRQQLARTERLRDIVVRADLQSHDPIGLFAARGEHDDRDIGLSRSPRAGRARSRRRRAASDRARSGPATPSSAPPTGPCHRPRPPHAVAVPPRGNRAGGCGSPASSSTTRTCSCGSSRPCIAIRAAFYAGELQRSLATRGSARVRQKTARHADIPVTSAGCRMPCAAAGRVAGSGVHKSSGDRSMKRSSKIAVGSGSVAGSGPGGRRHLRPSRRYGTGLDARHGARRHGTGNDGGMGPEMMHGMGPGDEDRE